MKKRGQVIRSAAPVTQNHLSKPEDLMLFKCPTPTTVFETATKPSCFAHFWQGAESLAPATRNDI